MLHTRHARGKEVLLSHALSEESRRQVSEEQLAACQSVENKQRQRVQIARSGFDVPALRQPRVPHVIEGLPSEETVLSYL